MEPAVDNLSSYFVAALIENRAKEVGLAAFDLRSASLHLSQFIETSRSYQNTMTLLHFFDPTDIIITPPNPGMFGVSSAIEHSSSLRSRKVVWPRRCFDDTKGALMVKNLAVKEPPALGLDSYYKQYYLCLGAAAAVIKWIENEKGVTITYHSIQVNFNGSVNHMSIDATSVQNLEVIEALTPVPGKITRKCNSLFSLLNTTRTIGGARLLRANLLQPLKDIQTINTRLDCLDELMSNEKLFFGLSQALLKFPKDIDRVLSHFCFKQRKNVGAGSIVGTAGARRSQALVVGVILLKEAIEALPFLSEVLKNAKSYLLCNISKSVCEHPGFKVLKKSIEEVIDDDVLHARAPFVARTQQCFAVKSGMNGLLDVSRRTFCDTSEAIHALAKKYREEMGLPNLKMPFNSRRGFYITIPEKDVDKKLPHVLTQVIKQGKNIQCSTQELTSLNVRNKEAAEECYLQTELCLEGLYDKIREEIWVLSLLSESLCLLDMVVNSFANMISTKQVDSYTRPEFTESGPIAIELGRHPVIECIRGGDFVEWKEHISAPGCSSHHTSSYRMLCSC